MQQSLLYRNPEGLYREYIENKRSIHQIAKGIGVSGSSIHKWLHQFSIPARGPGEGAFLANKNELIISPYLYY